MTKHLRRSMLLSVAAGAAQLGFAADRSAEMGDKRLERIIRRELITLPFYSLFDHLAFRVDGFTVTLTGKVSRPILKSDAENAVKRIEGVTKVVNQIEVLPLSPNDDRLRTVLYQAIYGHGTLRPLAIRAIPPIHIIVENGNVTLEGAVGTELEKNLANALANGVSGVFSVKNNLRVETRK